MFRSKAFKACRSLEVVFTDFFEFLDLFVYFPQPLSGLVHLLFTDLMRSCSRGDLDDADLLQDILPQFGPIYFAHFICGLPKLKIRVRVLDDADGQPS